MNSDKFGVIEMVFSFGLILAFAVWQLISLERAKKATRAKIAERAAQERER